MHQELAHFSHMNIVSHNPATGITEYAPKPDARPRGTRTIAAGLCLDCGTTWYSGNDVLMSTVGNCPECPREGLAAA